MLSESANAAARLALVVDDHEVSAAMAGAVLESQGWTVHAASDGFAALERLRTQAYRALILDYNLKGMDGVDVLAWVRRNMRVPPAVIVVSSAPTDYLRNRFSGMGVQAILSKPLCPEAFVGALATALKGPNKPSFRQKFPVR